MKKIIFLICTCISSIMLGQDDSEFVYRRSSLNVIFIDDFSNLKNHEKNVVKTIIDDFKLPEKYNDHSLNNRLIDISGIEVSRQDTKPYRRSFAGSLLNAVASNVKATFGVVDVSEEDPYFIAKTAKWIEQENIPGQLVAKWFNKSEIKTDGSYFNMDLIQKRGAYNASKLEILRSNESVRGEAILKDAGMDLIPNTFCVFIRLHYMSMSEWYLMMAERYISMAESAEAKAARAQGAEKQNYLQNANKDRETAYKYKSNATNAVGYFVSTTSYLFQLEWNDEHADEFMCKYYQSDTPNEILENNIYKMKYIGKANSQNRMTNVNVISNQSIYAIKVATMRAIDKSLAKLQEEFEDFSVKTPIITIDNKIATAFIGTKEGIKPGSNFEVLELKYDQAKNIYRYVKKGKLQVDKSRIWNNIFESGYNDDEENSDTDIIRKSSNKVDEVYDRTYLKGANSQMAPGMIIRQIK